MTALRNKKRVNNNNRDFVTDALVVSLNVEDYPYPARQVSKMSS